MPERFTFPLPFYLHVQTKTIRTTDSTRYSGGSRRGSGWLSIAKVPRFTSELLCSRCRYKYKIKTVSENRYFATDKGYDCTWVHEIQRYKPKTLVDLRD